MGVIPTFKFDPDRLLVNFYILSFHYPGEIFKFHSNEHRLIRAGGNIFSSHGRRVLSLQYYYIIVVADMYITRSFSPMAAVSCTIPVEFHGEISIRCRATLTRSGALKFREHVREPSRIIPVQSLKFPLLDIGRPPRLNLL